MVNVILTGFNIPPYQKAKVLYHKLKLIYVNFI